MLFTEADQQVLAVQRYLHPHPLVQRKMEALWLKSHNSWRRSWLPLGALDAITHELVTIINLSHTQDQHKEQLDTLLTLKFQKFDPQTAWT